MRSQSKGVHEIEGAGIFTWERPPPAKTSKALKEEKQKTRKTKKELNSQNSKFSITAAEALDELAQVQTLTNLKPFSFNPTPMASLITSAFPQSFSSRGDILWQ